MTRSIHHPHPRSFFINISLYSQPASALHFCLEHCCRDFRSEQNKWIHNKSGGTSTVLYVMYCTVHYIHTTCAQQPHLCCANSVILLHWNTKNSLWETSEREAVSVKQQADIHEYSTVFRDQVTRAAEKELSEALQISA